MTTSPFAPTHGVCLLCKTPSPTIDTLGPDDEWRCPRCGQLWTAARVKGAAAYAAWSAEYDRVAPLAAVTL